MYNMTLKDYVTSDEIKNVIDLTIKASQIKKKSFPHTLITGSPGTGKTTLAKIIAYEMSRGVDISSDDPSDQSTVHDHTVHELLAQSINSETTLFNILLKCKDGDIVFIDEIHDLKDVYAEKLYTVMENRKISITIVNKPFMYDVPDITIIGATTDPSLILTPLYDRFKLKIQLTHYTVDDMKIIVSNYINQVIYNESYNMTCNQDAIDLIAAVSRATPRIAVGYMDRILDYMLVNSVQVITYQHVLDALNLIGIDKHGLNTIERKIIQTVYETASSGAISLDTLSSIMGYNKKDISTVYEPYLISNEYIAITNGGRTLNHNGYTYMNSMK